MKQIKNYVFHIILARVHITMRNKKKRVQNSAKKNKNPCGSCFNKAKEGGKGLSMGNA